MLTIKVDSPADVAEERQREFADTVIGAAVNVFGVERADVRLVLTQGGADDERERREAAFWAAAWSGC
ncbi:hypothetical protein ABZ297_21000 [Nonomuraea sp. NPDC005983]|uniref:hypothetical protein n=1 Tax=Nonomuraea sp. NPDC005983 TaxID=3155595 RepID=UPI0033B774A8